MSADDVQKIMKISGCVKAIASQTWDVFLRRTVYTKVKPIMLQTFSCSLVDGEGHWQWDTRQVKHMRSFVLSQESANLMIRRTIHADFLSKDT